MSALMTIMLLSALPFPILAAIEVADWFKQPCRYPGNDRGGVSSR